MYLLMQIVLSMKNRWIHYAEDDLFIIILLMVFGTAYLREEFEACLKCFLELKLADHRLVY